MNFKKKKNTSKTLNLKSSKRKIRKGYKNSDCKKDNMRACRRNYGEGLTI
jgi:hypothetical protein